MNKAELKAKWAKYCDTDKLVEDVRKLLRANHHNNSEHGVCTLLDKYFTNKEPLIKLFVTSNHYAGDMRIITKQAFERELSQSELNNFFNGEDKFHSEEILQKVDEQGKTMHDYLLTGKRKVTISDLCNAKEQQKRLESVQKFDYEHEALKESVQKYDSFNRYLEAFKRMPSTTLRRDLHDPNYKGAPTLKEGTKTSRAFNKVCQHYGIDKLCPETKTVNGVQKTVYPYDRVFAEYSDMVSGLQRQMYFVISLNPLDYLQMSYGISWYSCHRINGGGWQGGCLSYMLDHVSMVTFVVNHIDEPIHTIPRFYRQMFHYEKKLFMQNRLYPSANDGATDLYAKFRNFMIDEFNELLNEDGEWTTEKGSKPCYDHAKSIGAHYVDYSHNNSCTIFFPNAHADKASSHVMTVGHAGICVNCGKEHTQNGRLNHGAACYVR